MSGRARPRDDNKGQSIMKITINGKPDEIAEGTTILDLLEILNIPLPGTAVAIGNAIVSRDEHETRLLSDGDRVEVIRAIGGG